MRKVRDERLSAAYFLNQSHIVQVNLDWVQIK